eukprot:5802863-Prymnesium_polylepis.2
MTVWFSYSHRSRSDELTSSASDQNGRSFSKKAVCAAVIHPVGATLRSASVFGLRRGVPMAVGEPMPGAASHVCRSFER